MRSSRRHLHFAATWNSETGRRIAARISWLDFDVLGSLLFVIGIAAAICILITGRCLSRPGRYSFALVTACVECLFIPFGTIPGVFTTIVLFRESVKAFFAATHTSV